MIRAQRGIFIGHLAVIVLLVAAITQSAQAWAPFTTEELAMQAPEWCSDADVVALDVKSEYLVNPFSGISGTHRHRIKILTDKGKAAGSVSLVVPVGTNVSRIAARTIKPDGKTVKVKEQQIFRKTIYAGQERDLKRTVIQIAFPEVVAGCILECEWKTFSEYLTFIPPHYFDVEDMPTLSSELSFTIPQGVVYQFTPVNTKRYAFSEKTEEGLTSEGAVVTYHAVLSNIRSGTEKPYAPGEDFLRPHIYFVFTRYKNAGIHVEIVPDWTAAVKRVENQFEPFRKKAKSLPSLLERIRSASPSAPLPEALYRWVTDSIAFVDSRLWTDVAGTIDDKMVSRKATGMEKALILQSLYKLAGIPCRVVLINPASSAPTLTRLPAITQFETYLLAAQVNGDTLFLDPTREGTQFGMYRWDLGSTHGLVIDKDDPTFVMIPGRSENNALRYDLACQLDSLGTLSVSGSLRLTNQLALAHKSEITALDSVALKSYLAEHFLAGYAVEEVVRAVCNQEASNDTLCVIDMDLQKRKYAEGAEEDLLVKPNCVARTAVDLLPQDDKRLVDLDFSFPRVIEVKARYVLPERYELAQGQSGFARANGIVGMQYNARIDSGSSPNEFIYSRRLGRGQADFPASDYSKVRQFFQQAAEYDNAEFAVHRRP
jgi:hypothetical protein